MGKKGKLARVGKKVLVLKWVTNKHTGQLLEEESTFIQQLKVEYNNQT